MGYFQGEEHQAIYNETIAIQLSDGRKAYMRHLAEDDRYVMHCNNAYALNPQNVTAVQRLSYIDEKTDSEVFVELIYMPNGEEPEKTVIFENESMDYVQLKLAVEEDNLWIRAACDDKAVDLDYVLNAGEVFISDAHSYDLGDTLRFYDDEDVIRIWGDRNDYGYVRQLKGNLFRIECGYTGRLFKVCNVNGFEYELEISSVTFEEHYQRWVSQIETAKARGHRIYPVYRLEDVECNNMTYQVYLQDKETAVGYDGYNLVLSPVQEKNFAVTMSIDELAVDATTLQNGSPLMEVLVDSDFEKVLQVLDNIYLKDDVPDTTISGEEVKDNDAVEGDSTVQNPLAAQNVPVAGNKALLDLSEYEDVGWSNGGVVPVQKDGLWGLIDYYGNEILEPTYTGFWSSPNNNGYTIFNDSSGFYIVDKEGKEIFTGADERIVDVDIAEKDIYLVKWVESQNVRFAYYNIDGSVLYDTGWHMEDGMGDSATIFHDGVAYYHTYTSEYNDGVVYEIDTNGTLTVHDYGWSEHPIYHTPYIPADTYSDGYMLVSQATGLHLYEIATKQASEGLQEVKGSLVPGFEVVTESNDFGTWEVDTITDWSLEYHKTNGAYFYHYGPYGVVEVTYNGDQHKKLLFNYWDIKDYILDSCIAVYDNIIFDDYKYLAVQDGDQWYYIDYDGNIVSGPYQDATSFDDEGYALVIEDNVAYLVNDRFEALERIKGVQVTVASLSGNRFLLEDTDGIQYLYNHDMN